MFSLDSKVFMPRIDSQGQPCEQLSSVPYMTYIYKLTAAPITTTFNVKCILSLYESFVCKFIYIFVDKSNKLHLKVLFLAVPKLNVVGL